MRDVLRFFPPRVARAVVRIAFLSLAVSSILAAATETEFHTPAFTAVAAAVFFGLTFATLAFAHPRGPYGRP